VNDFIGMRPVEADASDCCTVAHDGLTVTRSDGVAKSTHNLRRNTMSKTCDDSERKGCKEQPCDEAKRCTDGTLRLPCDDCEGTGEVTTIYMSRYVESECTACEGTGTKEKAC
jgi:hypothetical protein